MDGWTRRPEGGERVAGVLNASEVEVWFSIIERQAIHRGTFTSVKDLNAKIRAFITSWNNRAHPFVWTKTADQVLKKANRKKTSDAGH